LNLLLLLLLLLESSNSTGWRCRSWCRHGTMKRLPWWNLWLMLSTILSGHCESEIELKTFSLNELSTKNQNQEKSSGKERKVQRNMLTFPTGSASTKGCSGNLEG
jgi:hypothetical protein